MPNLVVVEQLIKISPDQVYHAFTNATALREWLCEVATAQPHPGGRMYLWWNGDFYSSGEYLALKPNRSLTFLWQGRGDPKATKVSVRLKKQSGGTLVRLEHKLPASAKWAARVDPFREEWKASLENLAAVLETGRDLRIVNRPMLGIQIDEFTPEVAKRLGAPVTEGLRLSDTVANLGADAAGLKKDDIIVKLADVPVHDFASLAAALSGKKGGDTVEVVFYRGAEKKAVQMTLSKRPVPDIPFVPAELAAQVKAKYEEGFKELAACFEGVSEAEASFKPGKGKEWSAKEVLAHLIQGERFNLTVIGSLISGFEPWTDDWGGNPDALVRATVKALPTVPVLIEELKRLQAETVAMIAEFPPAFVARKGSYFRTGWGFLEGGRHTHDHLDQIRAAITAGKRR